MAAPQGRRRKSQARREPGLPAWIWLVGGVLIGVIGSIIVIGAEHLPGAEQPTPAGVPQPRVATSAVAEGELTPAPESAAAPTPMRYEFYTLLTEKEVAVADAEIAAEAAKPAEVSEGSFVLQAGAFRNPGDADRMKAELTLQGLVARVETQTIRGEAWHRVRLGPFSASEADATRRRLGSGGIESIAIRAD